MTLRPSRRKRTLSGNLIRRRRDSSSKNNLKLETLEPRQLLAVGPQLLGIQPNTGSLLADGATREIAPNSLTFNFDARQALDANTLDGIRITRSGADGIFGNGNDVIVTPGFIGIGDRPSEVIVRFAETLPDDQYRIEVFGFDDPTRNIEALRNDLGEAFMPTDPATDRDTIDFELDLGAQVISVVPQPVTRAANGSLTQARNQVVVYFNNDDLHTGTVATGDLAPNPTVVDPSFYKLISTFDGSGTASVTNTDDQEFSPTSIFYEPALDRAVLTFSDDISNLAGEGTYRLRIGTNEVQPAPPTTINVNTEPGDNFADALNAGNLSGGATLTSTISGGTNRLEFPGAIDEPGHRDITVETHINGGADLAPGATIQPYNFQDVYGFDPNTGEPFHNAINEEQIERAREIFQLYSYYLGIQFYETANQGLTVATGDLRAADPTIPSAPGGVAGLGGPGMAVMDAAEPWNDAFGGSWFDVALHEIGHAIGQGHTYDLPPGTTQGSEGNAAFGGASEPLFPGNHDIVHGRHIHRPDGTDIDIYRFTVADQGKFTADIIAERQANSSLLDSVLTLYRENTDGTRELISRNDDYFSEDPHLELTLKEGTYFIAVSAAGNTDFDPNRAGSGLGGRSQGLYDLRMNFRPIANQVIVDATGTDFDGDADGTPGGTFNFWFNAVDQDNTVFVDKIHQPPVGQPATGSLANPYNEIDVALSNASPGDIVRIVGNGGADDNLDTLQDNQPYQLGANPLGGGSLADGASLRVPKDVTVMIDAGAIFKVNQSFISTGSNNVVTDRSGSALQVLGTPEQSVFFTSYNDENIGLDTNPAVLQTPQPGNWGGIVFRRDVDLAEGRFDYEQRGVFLNHVNHADIRFGGGRVTLGSVPQPVEPLFVSEARPTFSFNTITASARAAISVDPDSFEESTFLEPRFQAVPFTPGYTRVGPDVHGNRVTGNTTNGLFIRVATPDGSSLKPLTVAARFDDTDIVHVMAENVDVRGTAGGGTSDGISPAVEFVTLTPLTGGFLPFGFYDYRITFVDSNGNESLPSEITDFTFASGSIRLDNLPTVPSGFVGRRIYRSDAGFGADYRLAGQTTATAPSFVDNGSITGAPLVTAGVNISARLDASLVVDPGTIIKSNGARFDVTRGASFIAEGQDGREVIFTSLRDDEYGASGTFDTNADADLTTAQPADWAGIYVGHTSTASIDRALLAYGGGSAALNGNNADSNVVEIHQATVRITNSDFRDNDNGTGGSRSGRTSNAPGTIFVRGAQPVIVGNTFRDNAAAAININVDALNHELNTDYGRSTGMADATPGYLGNHGPLIRENRLSDNGVNGMEVRGATLTTQSVWDDTDIVHVLRGQVISPDFHTYGGVRLQSNPNESLVVKLAGNGGFTATGRYLDIDDRIGGTVQLVGQPNSPVILTSLGDNTVGAGFDINGLPQTDTAGNGTFTAAAGDWQGITFAQNANDRNVGVVTEYENPTLSAPGENATPDTAQLLGRLAAGEQSTDETNRLGFEIHGQLNERSDVDVYSFNGVAGTLVWLDFDRTATSLDTVIELVDDNNQVLARVDNSLDLENGTETEFELNNTIRAGSLAHMPQRGKDYWGTNPADAGMRVVLPGAAGSSGLFYLRVRSSSANVAGDLLGGESAGKYQLQLRLRDTDEVPGSTVKFADIRYAENGVTIEGQPQHSPLLGEAAEQGGAHNNPGNAQPLGNVLNSDRGAISIAASLGGAAELDFYEFQVNFDSTQVIPGSPADPAYVGVTFDIDYADGLGRPDTILSIFDANQNLVFTSRNAGINQDVPKPFNGSDVDDLSRGSVGTLDPFIGTVMLPEGTYYAAVSSNARLPQELDQLFTFNPANPNVRLEPVNSVIRIAEDHINSGYFSTAEAPQVPVLFDDQSFIDYQLGDVSLFIAEDSVDNNGDGTNSTRVRVVDPFTGAREYIYSTFGADVGDIATRPDGTLTAFRLDLEDGTITDAEAGNFLGINPGAGAPNVINDDGIVTYQEDVANNPGMEIAANDGIHFNAMAYNGGDLVAVGNRGGARVDSVPELTNILYRFNTDGQAQSAGAVRPAGGPDRYMGAGTDIVEEGIIDTTVGGAAGGNITGMATIGGRLLAVSEEGDLFQITGHNNNNPNAQTQYIATITDELGNPVSLAGLSVGPAGVGINPITGTGGYSQTLFGVTSDGDIYAFDANGVPVPTFRDGATMISTGSTNVVGLAFSTLTANPWHFTGDRSDRKANGGENIGHGVTTAPDDSRADFDGAGSSLYFGRDNGDGFADNDYNFLGSAQGSVVSNAFSLQGYAASDQPVLYFNYFLETENATYSPTVPTDFRDSLRAYVQDDDGQWRLVATNNEFRSNNFFDEFDTPFVYGDVTADTAVLHDSAQWRQARVDLSQFAGMDDLRLRFEFDTAGGGNTGSDLGFLAGNNSGNTTGSQLHAIPGLDLRDGDQFTIATSDGFFFPTLDTFEFESGFTLVAPTGSAITDGERFTIISPASGANTYEFDSAGNGTTGGFPISVDADMSPAEVAFAIANALNFGGDIVPHLNGERLNLEGVTSVTQAGGTALTVEGSPGTSGIPIFVNEDMTSEEVAEAIVQSFADFFAAGDTSFFTRDRDMIRLIGHRANDPGPLGLSEELFGEGFGAYGNDFQAAQNNAFEGAYIDDIIIGFAERGEMVTGANPNANYTPNIDANDNDNVEGRYQLEIRRSEDYGVPTEAEDLPFLGLTRSFDTNDRLAQKTSLQTVPGFEIATGDTFTLSDGLRQLTFEFTDTGSPTGSNIPVLFSSTDDAAQIAQRIRDVLNSDGVRSILDIAASDSAGALGLNSTSDIVHLYGEIVLLDSTSNRVTPIYYDDTGDSNRFRDQGMIVIQSSYITDSQEYGIRNLRGTVAQGSAPGAGNFPHAGPPRQLDVPNLSKIVPGIAITNNVIARNTAGGIDFAGDPTGNGAVPNGRIINNTIVGTGGGQGVRIRDNAAPTLLNNIIANFANGIEVTNNGGNTVIVNGTLFQDNGTNGVLGSNAIPLPAGAPLFRDAAAGNYYLAPAAAAIDSAVDSMDDRPALTMVRGPVGIAPAPVKSPETDITGQLRTDDFTTPNTGSGQNPFKDRGAIERADFTGPTIELVNPRDNDSEGNDTDPTVSIVQSLNATFTNFTLQLLDGSTNGGSGVDPATVSSNSLTITEDGRQLIEGVDYRFSYAPSSGTILLEPVAGIFQPDSVYVITLNNEDRFVVEVPSGEAITDGQQFSITDNNNVTATYEFDSGFTLQVPETLTITVPAVGNAPGGVLDNQTFVLGNASGSTTFEFNTGGGFNAANVEVPIPVDATADEIADALVTAIDGQPQLGFSPRNLGNGEVHLGSVAGHITNLAGTALTVRGMAEGLVDGDQVTVGDGVRSVTFEFNSVGGTSPGSRNIALSASDTNEELADRLAAAIGATSLGLDPTHFGSGFIHIGGEEFNTLDVGMSNLQITGTPGVTPAISLQVPVEGGGIGGVVDGEQFTITQDTTVVTFEFDSDGTSTVPPEQTIGVSLSSDQDALADQIVAVLTNYATTVGWPIAPQNVGGGVVELGEPFGFSVDTSATALNDLGIGGGAIEVDYVPTDSFDVPKVAEAIRDTINAGAQPGLQARLRAGRELVIEGASAVTDLTATEVPAIRDLANNPLQANQQSGETMFTILLGEPELDFGDAPDPSYATLFANNGARHALTSSLLLGTTVTGDANGQPDSTASLDSGDEGVVFNGIFNANVNTPITVTSTGVGVLDAWLDFNGDGDWNDPGEQIFLSKPIQAGDNQLTITPAASVVAGTTYARFRISSGGNLSPTGLAPDGEVEDYQVTILPGTPPVANNDDYVTDEDSSLTVAAPGIFANDTDADGDPITLVRADSTSSFGAPVNVNDDGSFTYDPTGLDQFNALPAGSSLSDSFSYVATDDTLESEQALVFIEVTGMNDAPTATVDFYTISEDSQLNLPAAGLLSNDFDIDLGDTFSLTSVGGTGSLSGMSALGVPVTATADGGFSYNPTGNAGIQALSAGEAIADTISYTITDAAGETSTTTVTITLVGANDSPSAVSDSYSVSEDSMLDVPAATGLLANDSDIDQDGMAPDDTISVITTAVTSARGVAVQIDSDGAFRYDPRVIPGIQSLADGVELVDTFTYTISDGNGGVDIASVSITVTGENDPPEANNDNYSANENFILSVSTPGVRLNDTDVDEGDSITVTGSDSTSALGAVVVMQADGSFTYNPTGVADLQSLPAGMTVADTFTYTIEDQSGVADTATVTITVSGSNDQPTAVDDSDASFSTSEDSLLSITAMSLLDNDIDIDTGDTLTVRGFNGTASLTGVTALGADVQLNADGTFSYDPRSSATLQAMSSADTMTDTFTYTIGDSGDLLSTATVSVVVSGSNDAPTALADEYTVTQDSLLTVSAGDGLQANDSDVDSDSLTTTRLDRSEIEGVLDVDPDGSFSYDPRNVTSLQEIPAGTTESFTFTYTLDDGDGATSTATVTINVVGVNNLPMANDDSGFTTNEDTPITIEIAELLSNDSDPDNDTLTLTPVGTSKLGVPVSLNGANQVVYDPSGVLDSLAAGDSATDEFRYTIDDGNGATASATVAVVVIGRNDDPVVSPAAFQTTEDTPRTLVAPGLLLGATDVDSGDDLTLTAVQSPSDEGAIITFQEDGSILYNPVNAANIQALPQGASLTDTFTYTIEDGNGGTITSTATVTVTGVNDRPTTVTDFYNASEIGVLNVNSANGVLANDSDIDTGNTLTAAVSSSVLITTLGAMVSMQPDGSFTYDPASSPTISGLLSGEQVIDSFVYTASDNAGGNREGNVQVTVTGTNEHPWQNEALRFDVDNNGFVSNGDALIIISRLRRTGAAALPVPPNFPIAPPPFYDVNGDDMVTLSDAIDIVGFLTESLNAKNDGGEGEGESIAAAAEKASSQSIVSSSNALKPVKLAARQVEIEEVAEAPAIDLFLASSNSPQTASSSSAISDKEDDALDLTLDSIATDVGEAWG